MSEKPMKKDTLTGDESIKSIAQLQEAGFGNMVGMSTAWIEALSNMGAEMIGFAAERIKGDVKTQHDVLQCNNVGKLQHVLAQFIQKALDEYQQETGKLVAMSTNAFTPKGEDKAT